MSVIPLRWQLHGMGVATAVLHSDANGDVRLHVWSKRFQVAPITALTGAIHRHSFGMASHVLQGEVTNTPIGYSRIFGPNEACGDELWNCWEYRDGVPNLTSAGYLIPGMPQTYKAGSVWTMAAGDAHFFEADEAITLVVRTHDRSIPNDVFVCQGASDGPPINGRSCYTQEQAEALLQTLPTQLATDGVIDFTNLNGPFNISLNGGVLCLSR